MLPPEREVLLWVKSGKVKDPSLEVADEAAGVLLRVESGKVKVPSPEDVESKMVTPVDAANAVAAAGVGRVSVELMAAKLAEASAVFDAWTESVVVS